MKANGRWNGSKEEFDFSNCDCEFEWEVNILSHYLCKSLTAANALYKSIRSFVRSFVLLFARSFFCSLVRSWVLPSITP